LRKAAVTGGSGQLGTLIVRRLLARADIDAVVCIDRSPPRIASTKVQFIDADIRDQNLDRHFAGCDTVVHCAFLVTSNAPADVYHSVNVEGSKNVFRAAAAAGSKAIVYMSSIAAYGCVPGHPLPITEDTPRIRQSEFSYSECKFEVEAFLDGFEREHPDIAISRIRPNILLGRLVPHALGQLLRKGQVPPGRAPLPIVSDEDVADLVLLAVEKRARGPFNAGVEELLTPDELAKELDMTVAWIPRPLVLAYGMLDRALKQVRLHLPYDISWLTCTQDVTIAVSSLRARNELGWRPRYPTAIAVLRHFLETAPRRLDRRLAVALWLVGREGRRQPYRGERPVCVHLCIGGEYGGDCSVIAAVGRTSIRRGTPKYPTSAIFVSSIILCGLLAGTADPDRALRNEEILIEGDAEGYEVMRWIVESFASLRSRNSLAGATARLLMRSLSGKAPLLVPSTSPKTEPPWPSRNGPSL
jgi:nucleoside-diphosphate-sugar epimerase